MNDDPPPASTDPSRTPKPSPGDGLPWWMARLFLLAGVHVCCVATGVNPIPEEKIHAPWQILFIVGMFFVCLGFFLFHPHDVLANRFLLAGIFGCIGTVGPWCAFFGDAANFRFQGIQPLVAGARGSLGRIVFGVGGGFAWLMAGAMLTQGPRNRRGIPRASCAEVSRGGVTTAQHSMCNAASRPGAPCSRDPPTVR